MSNAHHEKTIPVKEACPEDEEDFEANEQQRFSCESLISAIQLDKDHNSYHGDESDQSNE